MTSPPGTWLDSFTKNENRDADMGVNRSFNDQNEFVEKL